MPRVNFVTQNKPLETSESRNDKESVQRAARDDNIRTDIVSKEDDRQNFRPVRPRQAIYYPEESRRQYYPDTRYYPYDDLYRRDPYYDLYDRRRYYENPRYASRVDRYDDVYDNYIPRKPKRIIYYAHLPEVGRSPPSVDLTQRWDPLYRRPEEDYYARTGRYDYRFRNRYPYVPLRKDERNYRDLSGAGTSNKEKKLDDKITATPVLPEKQDKYKKSSNVNRNNINSHQYHDNTNNRYDEPMMHKSYVDLPRPDDGFMRYEDPLFQSAVDDQYKKRY
ncbi:hypothetical protein EVAR_19705_1 [Eumeta japonica]|uniref:Uncharacterized protein n=1 Tax=Eumeta variegata TaxID=151549 RepID=A0A4C1US72_EUMVA|nr:hypothetical protein EVAR_19705_1 [Eumeta japonica]